MATANLKVGTETESERIERWRREALERAGYSPDSAAELALRADVDLHAAIGLVERGCPPDIATQILL
jgi:hypothetical protein